MDVPAYSQVKGSAKNPPLIFLHGSFGSFEDWLEISSQFEKHYYCILLDLPGHGGNIKRDSTVPLNLDSVTKEVRAAVLQLAAQPAVFIGYGLGGRLSLSLALDSPELVRGLVLVSTHPGLRTDTEREKRLAHDCKQANNILEQGLEPFLDYWYELPVFASLHRFPERLCQIKKTRISKNQPKWAAKTLAELSPGTQTALWDRLEQIKVPVLLISGELDKKYTQLMKEACTLLPTSVHRVITDAGHNAQTEQPERVFQEIQSFLDRCLLSTE